MSARFALIVKNWDEIGFSWDTFLTQTSEETMQNTIHQLLEDLGNTFANHIKVANDNAEAAQAELAQIKTGLRLLVGEPSPVTVPLPQSHCGIKGAVLAEPKPRRKSTLSDEAFMAVLSTTWATAAKIRSALLANGATLSEGTTYNRMRKLAAKLPDVVEASAKPERWRLKSKSAKPQNEHARPTTEKRRKSRLLADPATVIETPTGGYVPILHHGDCLDVMDSIEAGSVDLILVDLPYGTTRCEGDVQLSLDRLWEHYRRVLKPTGTVVCFASQPFTSKLVQSNLEWFKYALVWEKTAPVGFLHAKNKPLKWHEDILVFSAGTTTHASKSKRRMTYNPEGVRSAGAKAVKKRRSLVRYLGDYRTHAEGLEYEAFTGYPRSILSFAKDPKHLHPFQKPLGLLKYLIQTYSNPGEVVLDNTMGSGSTCVAAMQTGRKSVGVEQNIEWFKIAEQRVAAEIMPSASNDNASASHAAFGMSVIEPAVASRSLTLYQGDCLDVMRSMPSGSVDLIFTSPPYNLGVSTGGGMKNSLKNGRWKNAALANGYATYDDARDPHEYIAWQKEFLLECWRLLSPTGAIFYQHKPRGQNKVLQTPLDLNPGLPVRQIIIWNRNSGFNFNSSYFLPSHEWIVVFAKPDFRLTDEGKRLKDVWTIKPERDSPHPAPFPVELPLTAIQATSAKVILDPFMGSGTTGVAALRCGREFIGIELDGGYLNDAHARIEAEQMKLAA